MIIEILGMPRSGKTTFLNSRYVTSTFRIIYENFSQVPYQKPESHKYNFWYANYVIEQYKNILPNEKVIIERGINDRIVMANALYVHQYITKIQLAKHLKLLAPYKNRSDILLIFNIEPKVSLRNINSPKEHFTRNLGFLQTLHGKYEELTKESNIGEIIFINSLRAQSSPSNRLQSLIARARTSATSST